MDGILLVDKPAGITSHKVIEIIRKKLNIRKVGHAGTLDPLATGLLIIMVGKATKLSNSLISQFKIYEVEMKLFLETDTDDITGKMIKSEKARTFTKNQVQETINSFNDYEYWQQPPIYSAIKIGGRKLYQYARRGIRVEVPARLVKIREIKLLNYSPKGEKINFLVECSKGTYIRSLVKDIAEKLETIGTVSQLRRISSGKFHITQAIKLEESERREDNFFGKEVIIKKTPTYREMRDNAKNFFILLAIYVTLSHFLIPYCFSILKKFRKKRNFLSTSRWIIFFIFSVLSFFSIFFFGFLLVKFYLFILPP